jgi:hypothetical protein
MPSISPWIRRLSLWWCDSFSGWQIAPLRPERTQRVLHRGHEGLSLAGRRHLFLIFEGAVWQLNRRLRLRRKTGVAQKSIEARIAPERVEMMIYGEEGHGVWFHP